jgi:hypothetical protein
MIFFFFAIRVVRLSSRRPTDRPTAVAVNLNSLGGKKFRPPPTQVGAWCRSRVRRTRLETLVGEKLFVAIFTRTPPDPAGPT